MADKYEVTITEILQKTVSVEADSITDAEEKVEAGWNCEEYVLNADDFAEARFFARRTKETGDRPEVSVFAPAVFKVNNDRVIRLKQNENDGPISIRTLSAPTDALGHRDLESEYEISAGDFVTMLNWYRYQKGQGNDSLMY